MDLHGADQHNTAAVDGQAAHRDQLFIFKGAVCRYDTPPPPPPNPGSTTVVLQ